jgi:hypothetical protein
MGLIDINIIKDTHESTIDSMKFLGWIIPFALGLLSSVIIDTFRSKVNKRKLKRFTRAHLKNDMIPQLATIKEEYIKAYEYIDNYIAERRPFKVFENFNETSLEAAALTDYYSVFKNDFTKLNEVKSTIVFLKQHLPATLIEKYFNVVNAHLKENDASGNMVHIKSCAFCIDSKEYILQTINLRVKEIDEVVEKINDLTKNHAK